MKIDPKYHTFENQLIKSGFGPDEAILNCVFKPGEEIILAMGEF